jgi:protein gp37
LIETPAAIKFVSAEPLLGPILFKDVPGFNRVSLSLWNWWIIGGAESGRGARPMELAWARSIRDQCAIPGVPFFMKQLSGPGGRAIKDMAEFPADLRVREMPRI